MALLLPLERSRGVTQHQPMRTALELLRAGLSDPRAEFRPGQLAAVEHIVGRRGPLLIVQRTGWGKSNVYFIATKLLRQSRSGPTLLISPLLALMRNQIAAAERMGLRAERITSEESSRKEWDRVRDSLLADEVDLLLISPERLANEEFMERTLKPVAARIGFLVIDEAHCISDWGHDFRPDYRRITRIIQAMPRNLPVLATTATANDRVVEDIHAQLGQGLKIVRGQLARPSLALQTIHLPKQTERLAWLAETLPKLPGSGIIYTLTIRDARVVAFWLKQNKIKVRPYWGGMDDELQRPGLREKIEQRLLKNEIKAIVATNALGMGFDKPDLSFVIHYQLPGSVIHYYQQVGRAGRALDHAYGVLLGGTEDKEISDYFINSAFPSRRLVEKILEALRNAPDGLNANQLAVCANASRGLMYKALQLLALETPAPVAHRNRLWHAASSTLADSFWERVERLTALRRHEQEQMERYLGTKQCLMRFLTKELDDAQPAPCGRCANCKGHPLLPAVLDPAMIERANQVLRQIDHPIHPRKMFPKGAMPEYGFEGRITEDFCAQEGRVLASWGDAGWGDLVRRGKYDQRRFDDELVAGAEAMIRRWNPQPAPKWITCVPSLDHPELVANLGQRLAKRLRIPLHSCVQKVRRTRPQKEMENSFQQAHNLDGAFKIEPNKCLAEPVILLDDMVDSGWTFTVIAALLRGEGCSAVYPVALADTSKTEPP